MKKIILLLVISSLLLMFAGPAQATKGWYTCTISYAGLNTDTPDVVYVNAVSQNGTWSGGRWFVVTGSEAKAVLATALAAWSMGTPVILVLDDAGLAEWSPLYGIFTTPN
ncbi:hypothetical protein ACFLZL_02055 [Thermodesulfobacteriota bacterium]